MPLHAHLFSLKDGAANFPATLACLYALPALAKEHGMPLGPAAAPYVFFLVVPAAMVVYAGGVTLELVQSGRSKVE